MRFAKHQINHSLAEHDMSCLSKQCRSRSVGFFWRSQLILICTVCHYVNFYQKLGSSNLNGWKLEVSVASLFIQHDKGWNWAGTQRVLQDCLCAQRRLRSSYTSVQSDHIVLAVLLKAFWILGYIVSCEALMRLFGCADWSMLGAQAIF